MLYKRTGSAKWWVRFTAPDGREVRRSTGTQNRREAQEYHDRLKSELWRQHRLGEKPRRTWRESVVLWATESAHKELRKDLSTLRRVDPYLGGLTLDRIDRDVIRAMQQDLKAQGLSNGRVNRVTAIVRAILRRAWKEWGWIDSVPPFRMLPEPRKRIRWITRDEAERLLWELPEHVAAMARFSLATGLRVSNVLGLEWSQVDLERRVAWIHADQAKARKPIGVPLNREAMGVLLAQQGRHPQRVFTFRGRPVAAIDNRTWKAACARAGITDFRWHDLRHTWASWHVQAGTPLPVLMELGGWSKYETVLRYAHLAPEHLAEHAERVAAGLRTIPGTAAGKGPGGRG